MNIVFKQFDLHDFNNAELLFKQPGLRNCDLVQEDISFGWQFSTNNVC